MITNIYRMMWKGFLPLYVLAFLPMSAVLTSCEKMLEQESDMVRFANDGMLNQATDTIYSVTGIMKKMQVLADRTVILGEVRGDLVDVTNYASSDIRDVALFNVGTENRYNCPRDYYAVINNCNYFLTHADTTLRNNQNQSIFEKEYAAVKAYRAWTYLQLALVYGEVPFVTEPIMDMDVDESAYPVYDIQQVCQYFINDLAPYANVPLPGYGTIGSVESKLTYIPVQLLLGELNLWAGNYRESALCYYRYISSRNGSNTSWPLGTLQLQWTRDDGKYERYTDSWSLQAFGTTAEHYAADGELITMIPGDTIPTSPNYSELPSLFNSNAQNDGYYALVPSKAMTDLSASQTYCNMTTTGDVGYAPNNLTENRTGDLRLSSVWHTYGSSGNRPAQQLISKYLLTTHVHLWRRAMVWLHMAEALNRAGMPEFAFRILSTGVNNRVMAELQQIYPDESEWLSRFNFPNNEYILRTESPTSYNTLGVHSRGCGFTECNEFYQMPEGGTEEQITAVEDMIIAEEALEFAFEGQRYYDLMRIALRRNEPGYLARHIAMRRGEGGETGITVDLTDKSNWFLPFAKEK